MMIGWMLLGVCYLLFHLCAVCFKVLFKVGYRLILWSLTLGGVIIAVCIAFFVGLFRKNPAE